MSNQHQTTSNELDLDAIFNEIRGPVLANRRTLDEVLLIADMPNEPAWEIVKRFYKIHGLQSELLATVLNRILLDRKNCFLLSFDLATRYLTTDPNLSRKGFSGTVYRDNMDKLLARANNNEAFFRCLVPFVKGKDGSPNMSAVYTLSSPALTTLIPWWTAPTTEDIQALSGLEIQPLAKEEKRENDCPPGSHFPIDFWKVD